MAIFKRRPLAAACVVLILSAAAAYPLSVLHTALLAIPVFAAFAGLLIFCIWRGLSYRRLFVLLVLAGALLGAGRTLGERYHAKALFEHRMDQTVEATLEVLEIESRGTYSSRLVAGITDMDGESCHARVLLVTEGMTPFYLGDRIQGAFTCTELQEHSFYQGQETQYRADGIYVAFAAVSDLPLTLAEDGTNSFRARIADWRGALHHRLTAVVPGEEGELISALLLDTKDSLENGTVLSFRRVGLSHLLALSGLHLAILAGALEFVMRFCRLGKRLRVSVLLCILCFYWLLTGCSFSMLRAVLMFAVLQLAFFSREDYDVFTSLCMAGALMVLVTPSAIFDLSFQMTMLATFGIVSFGELQGGLLKVLPRQKRMKKWLWSGVRTLISSLFITFAATLAILPIQWLIFGEMSLLTPVSNLVMIPLTTVLLWLSLPLLLLCAVPAVAVPIGVPLGWIAKTMLFVTERLSRLPCMLSLNYDFVTYIFIPLFILTALLLILDLKKLRALTLAPAGVAAVAFAVCLAVSNYQDADRLDAIYHTTGANDSLLLMQSGTAVICDISNGSATQLYNDYKLLQTHCATEVEVLMLTHYHTRQPTALSRFADFVMLRSLWLPEPQGEVDTEILAELLLIAAREEIAVTVYAHDAPLTVFGAGTLTVSKPLLEKRSVEPALDLRLSFGEASLTYQSAAYSEYARNANLSARKIADDVLILGGHGPVPHAEVKPCLGALPRELVISNIDTLLLCAALPETDYVLFPELRIYRLE